MKQRTIIVKDVFLNQSSFLTNGSGFLLLRISAVISSTTQNYVLCSAIFLSHSCCKVGKKMTFQDEKLKRTNV